MRGFAYLEVDRLLNVRCHKHSMQSILRSFYINELTAHNVLLDRIEICNIQDNVFVTEEMKTR